MNVTVKYNARRKLREELGLKREQLASTASKSVQTIFNTERWSSGTDVRVVTACALAKALGVSIEAWLALGNEPYGPLVAKEG